MESKAAVYLHCFYLVMAVVLLAIGFIYTNCWLVIFPTITIISSSLYIGRASVTWTHYS